ncbi:hypothetical protein ATO11_09460 [Pseudaestuariivita atlantica]|uniref:Uncharacterized protein n=2 Tax=Pseudaestuariivita atlantica TaxID=1317121 RepID=A0A0L1JRN4_9RHOB|nr:hypothetical protein ATO11_09460 [Pseudaestuariivita atlantica]
MPVNGTPLTSFDLAGDVPVTVSVDAWEEGSLRVTIGIADDAENTADITGIGFDVAADNVWAYSGEGTKDLTGGAYGTDVAFTFDAGAADMPREDVSLIIGSDDGPLSAEDLAGQTFAVSLSNVGPYEGPRDDSVELLGMSPVSDEAIDMLMTDPEPEDDMIADDGGDDVYEDMWT